MSNYQSIQSEEGGYHDIFVEVGFAQRITPNELAEILQIITVTISGKEVIELDFHLLGVSFLEVTLAGLKIKLRFKTFSTKFPEMDTEDLARQKANFVMHLFAKIDRLFPLEDVPFPAIYKDLFDLATYYGFD